MADYGSVGGGRSLRDAIMPMTGMGEYGAMFPPQTGGDQPGSPVPIPQPRPPMPPQMGMPPHGLPPQGGMPPQGLIPQGLIPQGLPQQDYAQRLMQLSQGGQPALPMPYLPSGGVNWGPRPPWNPTPASPPGIPRVG